jgi:hypothetical protein
VAVSTIIATGSQHGLLVDLLAWVGQDAKPKARSAQEAFWVAYGASERQARSRERIGARHNELHEGIYCQVRKKFSRLLFAVDLSVARA